MDSIEQPEYVFEPPMVGYHVTGGLSALAASNNISAILAPGAGFVPFCNASSDNRILLDQPGLRILGKNLFYRAEEMYDVVTSNFALAAPNNANQCLARSQQQYWNGVENALASEHRGADALIARRVNAQIRVCTFRLERLSIAYRTVLIEVAGAEPPSTNCLTNNKYAHFIGNEYRSFINELFSLRDALLGAAYRLRYGRKDSYELKKIRTLVCNEQNGSGKLIAESMFTPGGDQLIAHMALYRAVALHCTGDTNPIFGDVYKVASSKGLWGRLSYLVYPLYDDIEKMRIIEKGSPKGIIERLPREEAERFLQLPVHLDALEFCYDCLVRLLRVSEALQQEIPIEPKPYIITDKEILEAAFTSEDGIVRRFKRDPDTGSLVQY